MKAKVFYVRTDDRHRIVIPYANIKRINKKLGKNPDDWIDLIIQLEIKSIHFRDGKVVKF